MPGPRLIGYIRVSQVGGRDTESERFQTVDQQREAINRAVLACDGELVGEPVVDLGVSGGTMKRTNVEEAIRRVEAGEADGIVVAYLDRWARTVEALEMFGRWAEEGRTFISAAEQFDASTAVGRFTLGMMLLVAQFYREQTQERWRLAQDRAIARGAHVGGTPTGYLRDETGRLVPDPVKGPHVTECFRLAATVGHAAATEYARERLGINSSILRQMLGRRTYLGEIHHSRYEPNLNAHEPLTDERTWRAAQSEPRFRAVPGDFPLSGILRCRCGQSMSGQTLSRPGQAVERRYRCGNHERREGPHSAIKAHTIEEALRATLKAALAGATLRVGTATVDLDEVERRMLDAEAELTDFARDITLRQAFGEQAWREGIAARRDAVDEAQREYQDALSQTSAVVTLPAADQLDDDAELRRALLAMAEAVDVKTGRGLPLDERVTVRWLDDDNAAGVGSAERSG